MPAKKKKPVKKRATAKRATAPKKKAVKKTAVVDATAAKLTSELIERHKQNMGEAFVKKELATKVADKRKYAKQIATARAAIKKLK